MKLQTGNTQLQRGLAVHHSTVWLLLKAMRPKQWTKNMVVFAGIIFSQKIFVQADVWKTAFAFAIFCVLSGSVYIVNDIVDIEKDRAHPHKRYRPLASGQLSASLAAGFAVITTLASLGGAFWLNLNFGLSAAAYFALVTVYSFKLKNVVIIDVLAIAIGFVLRAVAGAAAIAVSISPWLLVCTFLLALFLALTKRRHELLLLEDNAFLHRKILDEYKPEMLEQMISVVTSSTVMAYSLYTFTSGHSHYLMSTIPFVIYGVFRYMYLVHQKNIGGSPEAALFKDFPMAVNIILWGISCSLILYYFK